MDAEQFEREEEENSGNLEDKYENDPEFKKKVDEV